MLQSAIRLIHTTIYGVMVASICYILFAGIWGQFNPTVLYTAIGLVTLECCVFIGNGWKCPLTTIAVSMAGQASEDYAPIIPASLGRYTPTLFGTIFALGMILLLVRLLWRA